MSRFPVLLLSLLLAACGASSATAAGDGGPPALLYSLCAAEALVADGDVAAADRRFLNDAHEPLHELADELTETDRAAAARLLQAKEAVEAGLADEPPPDDLRARFDALLTAARDGLAVDGVNVEGCPTDGGDA